jgi:hypothetical protein
MNSTAAADSRWALLAVLLGFLVAVAGACGDADGKSAGDDDSVTPAGDDDDDNNDDNDNDDDNDDDDDNDNDSDDDDDDDDDNDDDNNDDNDTSPPVLVNAGGCTYSFDPNFSVIAGAEVRVLERPDLPPVTTDETGCFWLENLHAGDELTLVLTHDAYFPTQTATLLLPPEGLFDISIQTPPRAVVWALSLWLLTWLDPETCQIAATVSPAGGTPYTPGIPGAQVEIDPPVDPDSGPLYFFYFDLPNLPPLDLPVRWLDETTDDGGVLFVNVAPGEYTLTASMDGVEFTPALINCRPGVLVNASPPYGLQMVE